MGYGSLYIVQNFGMLCITIFLPIIARLLAPFGVWIFRVGVCQADLSHYKQKSKNWLQYGFWVDFFDETYLFLMVCAGLNIQYNFSWASGGDATNSAIAVIFLAILVAFPLFVAIFYNRENNLKLILSGD